MPISPAKTAELERRMKALGIREEELEEQFIRASGKGGQNVNKVSTCVFLKHLPTGITVNCARERAQGLNRFHARRILVEKIEAIVLKEESAEAKRRFKISKQKRKRSKRAKAKMLDDKHHQAEKKQRRQKPSAHD